MVTCSLIDIFLATNDWLKTMQNYCRQESNTEKLLQRVVLAEAMKKKRWKKSDRRFNVRQNPKKFYRSLIHDDGLNNPLAIWLEPDDVEVERDSMN